MAEDNSTLDPKDPASAGPGGPRLDGGDDDDQGGGDDNNGSWEGGGGT
jgi:hypothetical protein